ncbi:MAG: protein kinase [Planctomycetota bacterium]|nr:protein kinase [Planctomycetota bacterium]
MEESNGKKEGADAQKQGPDNQDHSILELLEAKTGESPRISLRDEDSAAASSPVIDPSSKEKLSIPKGRGNYQFMGEIARGGMGIILKGHDTDLGRDIAVKVLAKKLCDRTDVVQRFVEEAQIGGQLQHPGIVPVYELGMMEDERPYFTMKLVKGRTLAALFAQRETPNSNRGKLIDVFESMCQTMAYAHSRGVLHRDLKPANIMVGAFGEVQVVDWGLAKVLVRGGVADEKRSREAQSHMTILETVRSEGNADGSQSLVGSVLGTPAYMPPEQARGQVDRLDERSDVFALGAILCEILTGSPPYIGEFDEVIAAAAQAELDGAYKRLDQCDADPVMVKAAKQCLVAAPAARPADAGVLAELIHNYVVSNEERAHQANVEAAEARVRAEEDRRARKLTLALGAAVVAAVLIGGGGWMWVQNERAGRDREVAAQRQEAAERDAALGLEINTALNEAAVFKGGAHWEEAISAAERARLLAEAGGASAQLKESVHATLADLRGELGVAQQALEQERDTQRLLAKLREASRPTVDEANVDQATALHSAFLAHGIDLKAGDLESAAGTLMERGRPSEFALILDTWGDVLRAGGDEDGALRLLEIAHTVDPDPDRAHLREAMASRDVDELRYLAQGDFTSQPGNTFALLANSLDRLGEKELSLSVYRRGLKVQLHYMLGSKLTPGDVGRGPDVEMQEASQHLRAAIALEPTTAWAYHYLARLQSKLGHYERALEEHDKALELEPDLPEFWFRKAQDLRELKRYKEARVLFERCVAFKGDSWAIGWGHHALAIDAARNHDYERTLEQARLALESGASRGQTVRVWMLAPFTLVAAGRGDQAALSEARKIFELEFGNFTHAHDDYSHALVRASKQAGFAFPEMAGSPEADRILLQEAVEVALAGIELEPTRTGLWESLGVAQYFLGAYEEAATALERANELTEIVDPSIWCALSMVYQAQGEEEKAKAWYLRALSEMAQNPYRDEEYHVWFRTEAGKALGLE